MMKAYQRLKPNVKKKFSAATLMLSSFQQLHFRLPYAQLLVYFVQHIGHFFFGHSVRIKRQGFFYRGQHSYGSQLKVRFRILHMGRLVYLNHNHSLHVSFKQFCRQKDFWRFCRAMVVFAHGRKVEKENEPSNTCSYASIKLFSAMTLLA